MPVLALLVAALAAPGAAQERAVAPLESVVELRWIPRDGRIEALQADGSLLRFDHRLRLLEQRSRVEDQPAAPIPQGCSARGRGDEDLQVRGPAGRTLHWDAAARRLWLGPASWEQLGSIQWGPDWARVAFRSQRAIGPLLEWEDDSGHLHLATVRRDARDPLLQKAHLRGLRAGQALRLRHRPMLPSYPSPRWSAWATHQVPAVDAAGDRPQAPLRSPTSGSR